MTDLNDGSLTAYNEAQPAAAASDQSHEIASLVSRLRELGKPEAQPLWGRASANYDHMGAKLADAVLQSGIRYEAFVRARVDQIARDYPLSAEHERILGTATRRRSRKGAHAEGWQEAPDHP